MNTNDIKKVHKYIERMNDEYDRLNTSEKKEYYNLIKPYKGYKNILHLLPKGDVNLILKNKFDNKNNKDKIKKIIENYNKKKQKEKELWKIKEIKKCNRYLKNKDDDSKKNKIIKKKSKKSNLLKREQNNIKEKCSKKNINRRSDLMIKLIKK